MKKVTAALLCVSLTVTACSSLTGKEIGTVAGAGIGGTIGGLAGGKKNRTGGILIGAAAGAIAGLAIGHCVDKRIRDAEETAKAYKYQPVQGTMIKIEAVRIVPEMVEPGKQAKLIIDYAILDGDPDQKIEVEEKRVIKIGKKALKEIGPTTTSRKSGTYSTEQAVVFPSTLSEGTYRLRGEVIANGKTSIKEAAFEVAEPMKGLDSDALRGNSAVQGIGGFAH